MTFAALEEAQRARLQPWIDAAGRLHLRGSRRAEPVARRLLADAVACAELARHAAPSECWPCFGRSFWRLKEPLGAPWTCGQCHPWPADPREIETLGLC